MFDSRNDLEMTLKRYNWLYKNTSTKKPCIIDALIGTMKKQ